MDVRWCVADRNLGLEQRSAYKSNRIRSECDFGAGRKPNAHHHHDRSESLIIDAYVYATVALRWKSINNNGFFSAITEIIDIAHCYRTTTLVVQVEHSAQSVRTRTFERNNHRPNRRLTDRNRAQYSLYHYRIYRFIAKDRYRQRGNRGSSVAWRYFI